MKYIIKFKKIGKIRFISHLDLQKVFLRLFRIIGVKPKYSNGYNPHPKLSFALPLSLGFGSLSEYIDLETEDGYEIDYDDFQNKLRKYLPDGLYIEYIKEKPSDLNKKLASYIDCAEYTIEASSFKNTDKTLEGFLKQESIVYEKVSRKTGKTKQVDIKPMILKMDLIESDNNIITLSALLHAGNDSVLNPNTLIEQLYKYADVKVDLTQLKITRTAVMARINKKIQNIDDLINDIS